jgi:hypothetical protein
VSMRRGHAVRQCWCHRRFEEHIHAGAGVEHRVERRNYEYVCQGTADLFVMVEPLAGWRHVAVSERRAPRLRGVSALPRRGPVSFRRVCAVGRGQSEHACPAALYATFLPQRAILGRLEFHYIPKHGSRLNIAEIEISVFERGCLSRPVADFETLDRRVKALETERNAARCTTHWQFISQKARTKLVDLYPVKQT